MGAQQNQRAQKEKKLKKLLRGYLRSTNKTMEICPKCGLPKQACVCEQIAKSSQRIQITTDKKRYGKIVTVVRGFDKGVDIKKTAKELKNEFACGGTYRDGEVELQGDHRNKVKDALIRMGFDEESIEE